MNIKSIKLLFEIIITYYYNSNKENVNHLRYSIMPYTKWHYKYIFKEI